MSIDYHACLILGLNSREIDFEKIPGFAYDERMCTEEVLDTLTDEKNIFPELTHQHCYAHHSDEEFVGFTLGRTRSLYEMPAVDLEKLTKIFTELFGLEPKLYLMEQVS